MTNNKQMVLVPRELLERVASAEIGMSAKKDQCAAAHELRELLEVAPAEDVRLISHAEDMSTCTLVKGDDGKGYFYDRIDAEDVRARVDEPFFYALCGPDGKPHYEELCVSSEPHHLEPADEGVTVIPLYRQARRKIVLPERMQSKGEFNEFEDGEVLGWNACIEEIERLNKSD